MLNSLNEPTRCRNHSRATKSGARTWKRNELCSNGVPWRSRSRNRMSPSSLSSIASLRRASLTPAGFLFAPKLPGQRPQLVAEFSDRVRRLCDRLGPVRVSVKSARDEGLVELLLGSLDPSLRLAFDLEHPSWDGIEPRLAEAGAVRVNDLEADASFRYVRLREPPYSDDDLARWAERLRGAAVPTFVYLRHEDEPSAPGYAARLAELLG